MYCAIAYRKCVINDNYDRAEHYINEALSKPQKDTKAEKEKKLILKLKEDNGLKKKPNIEIKEDYFKNNQRVDESKSFKILSIDGGGVRGLIPALWLNEIERRTLKPISHLFNMVAGTSVGGIIASALTVPSINNTQNCQSMSYFKPRYQAYEIVQLFKNESKNIFSNSDILSHLDLAHLFTEKYSNKGKLNVLKKYFGQAEIKDVLTDLMIPAYNETMGNQTYLFRNNEIDGTTKLFDVLMATSAAPTFFPAYTISSKGTYLDGGVNLNNPAMRAYTESKGRNFKKTFVLSLGTGSYIPDPSNPDKYRGKLFWAKNISGVVLHPQEGNIDIEMNNLLGERYLRCQVYMEKEIALDAYDDASLDYLIEMGKQYIEEEEDQMNNLVEILLKDNEFTI